MTRRTLRSPRQEASLKLEIAHLRALELQGLRARWKGVFRRPPPPSLPRHLLFAMLAYRIQAERLGDLSLELKALLDRNTSKADRPEVIDRLAKRDREMQQLAPGTVLSRPWNGRPQRVVVTADGFSWNGQKYKSLSRVAFAITGTRWNGPRFFGLRDKEKKPDARKSGARR